MTAPTAPSASAHLPDAPSSPTPTGQLLALLGVTGLAIAQPLLAVLGDNPGLYEYRGVGSVAIVGSAVAIVLVPPLVLWAVGLCAGAVNRRLGRVVHVAILGALFFVATLQWVKYPGGVARGVFSVPFSALAAVAFALAYDRWATMAAWVRYLAVLPALALGLFLVSSPTSDLLGRSQAVAEAPAASDLPSVVFVVFDELPTLQLLDEHGAIDAARYPNFAALPQEMTWYRHYTTQATLTTRAVPSLLIGSLADGPDDALWTSYPNSLFSYLAPTHELTAFESFTKMCGADTCVAGPPGTKAVAAGDVGGMWRDVLHLYRTRLTPGEPAPVDYGDFQEDVAPPPSTPADAAGGTGEPAGEAVVDLFGVETSRALPTRFADYLDSLVPTESGAPALYYLHLLLPHQPWRFQADGTLYDAPSSDPSFPEDRQNASGDWIAALTEARHDLQLEYTDRLLGEAVQRLKDQGLWDDSVVVVLADHGISFETDTPEREVRTSSLDSLAYSPLFVKAPHQTTGSVDDRNLMAIDVLPTVADLVGEPLPFAVDGVAASSGAVAARGEEKWIADASDTLGVPIEGRIEFDTSSFPDAGDRWIPPSSVVADPFDALMERARASEWMGRRLDDLVDDGRDALSGTIAAGSGDAPTGIVHGWVADAPADGTLLVAVDGVVVSASPLFPFDGHPTAFAALLPSASVGSAGDVRVAVVAGPSVDEVAVG